MEHQRFDVGLSYLIDYGDGHRDIVRNRYVRGVEADDREHALVVAQERLRVELMESGKLKVGHTLQIVSGSTHPCAD